MEKKVNGYDFETAHKDPVNYILETFPKLNASKKTIHSIFGTFYTNDFSTTCVFKQQSAANTLTTPNEKSQGILYYMYRNKQ